MQIWQTVGTTDGNETPSTVKPRYTAMSRHGKFWRYIEDGGISRVALYRGSVYRGWRYIEWLNIEYGGIWTGVVPRGGISRLGCIFLKFLTSPRLPTIFVELHAPTSPRPCKLSYICSIPVLTESARPGWWRTSPTTANKSNSVGHLFTYKIQGAENLYKIPNIYMKRRIIEFYMKCRIVQIAKCKIQSNPLSLIRSDTVEVYVVIFRSV